MRGSRSWIVTAFVAAAWFTGCGTDDGQATAVTASASGNGGGTTANAATTGSANGGSSNQSGSGGAGGSSPSSGCDKASPTGVQSGSITVGSDMRTYVLSVSDQYDPSTPVPLVFAWHGLGGSGTLARAYFGIEMQAGGAAIFVYPDGLIVQPQNAPGWELTSDGRDVAFFDALLAQLAGDYCIDEARVFSTGHSFGGFMSNALGCARSSVLRAIAPVAGGGPFEQSCDSGSLSAWLAHGTNDNVVAFTMGEGSRDHWLEHAACSMTSQPTQPDGCNEYQGCSMERVVWCTHADGHNWPDFAAEGIWGFFSAF